MKVLHVIEKRGLLELFGNKKDFIDESGYWPLQDADAVQLLHGMLYLHKAKSEPSWLGGIVLSYRREELIEEFRGLIVFKFKASNEGKNVRWKGKDHSMAWIGGVVDA
jgi:hypothetical protein